MSDAAPDAVRVVAARESADLVDASHLFDHPVTPASAARYLDAPGQVLLLARRGSLAVGFVSGVEVHHPDQTPEVLVYELGVAEQWRRRGVARALLDALTAWAQARGCRGLWVLTEPDNAAARATYTSRGADADEQVVLYEWPTER